MSFAFVLYRHKEEECNMKWPIANEANRCTFWTSCTGVSWERNFLWIMRNFANSSLTHMQILVGRVLHSGTVSTLKISYLACFGFSSCHLNMWTKRRHYSAGGIPLHMFHEHYTTRHWLVQIDYNSIFCVRFFCAWIWALFDHLAAPLLFISSVHRALKNTETVQFSYVLLSRCVFKRK